MLMTARKKAPLRGAVTQRKAGRPTPEALLERIAARDKGALLDLYARFAPVLLGVARQVAGHPREAAEAVEETFVRLWRQAPHFPHEPVSVAAWLVAEGRRAAMQRRQANKVAKSRPDGSLSPTSLSYAWLPRPDDVVKLESKRELLMKALLQLPRQQQAVLALAVWEGLTEEAIAEKTGEPLAKVQSSLRAAMRFIRHRMRVVLGTWSAQI